MTSFFCSLQRTCSKWCDGWARKMSVCLTHSTSIIEGESDTSFEEKRAHEFMILRNLSKCTLLCWIITSDDRFDRQSSMPHFLYKSTRRLPFSTLVKFLTSNPTAIVRHGNPTTIEQRVSWAHKK